MNNNRYKKYYKFILKSVVLSAAFLLLFVIIGTAWIWLTTRQKEVEFNNGSIVLRGTLLSPRFADKTPGIVFVHGSGQTSRKSMMLYAWIFAAKGYSALAYDKRGVGKSDGGITEWRDFSFNDLANDAAAAYRFLQSETSSDPDHIGFFGASQGGWVVSLAASRVDPPAFVIMVSASVSTVAEDRIYGREAQVRYSGFGEDAVNQAVELIKLDHQVTRSAQWYDSLLTKWNSYRTQSWFNDVYQDDTPLPINDPHRKWERTILDYDPQPYLENIKAPVLWIFGDPALDRFSPVKLSISRIEKAKDAGMPYQIIQINNVGHTIEPQDGNKIKTLLQIRIPLIRKIFQWLENQQ